MMRRLLALALGILLVCLGPLGLGSAADPQEPTSLRRIGVLLVGFSPESKEARAFQQGLRDAGYAEGADIVIEWRSAKGDYARVPELVADLVQRKVDVIVVDGTLAIQAVKRATSTTPIVMALAADPVGTGLVANLAHPGENVTGLSLMIPELNVKRLQLIKETIPHLTRVAVLWNPGTPWHPKVNEDLRAAAPSLSIELKFVSARTLEELGPALSAASRAHSEALYILPDGFFLTRRATLLKLALQARLPSIWQESVAAEAGGLMSYGANYGDLFRRSAGYVDRILKGARPSDLPIEQPIRFDLVVNLKTAKALGIAVPESILQRADEVIR